MARVQWMEDQLVDRYLEEFEADTVFHVSFQLLLEHDWHNLRDPMLSKFV